MGYLNKCLEHCTDRSKQKNQQWESPDSIQVPSYLSPHRRSITHPTVAHHQRHTPVPGLLSIKMPSKCLSPPLHALTAHEPYPPLTKNVYVLRTPQADHSTGRPPKTSPSARSSLHPPAFFNDHTRPAYRTDPDFAKPKPHHAVFCPSLTVRWVYNIEIHAREARNALPHRPALAVRVRVRWRSDRRRLWREG